MMEIIHGFPGDTPSGVIYIGKQKIIANIGENVDKKSNNPFVKWYSKLTKKHYNTFTVK